MHCIISLYGPQIQMQKVQKSSPIYKCCIYGECVPGFMGHFWVDCRAQHYRDRIGITVRLGLGPGFSIKVSKVSRIRISVSVRARARARF